MYICKPFPFGILKTIENYAIIFKYTISNVLFLISCEVIDMI